MNSHKISRRDFLRLAGLSASLIFWNRFGAMGRQLGFYNTARAEMEPDPFMPDAEISITAAEKWVQILSSCL